MHKLTIFADSICFSKVAAMGRLRNVVRGYLGFEILEKDLLRDADEARKLGVQMSPTLLLDGKILCAGIPDEKDLKAMIDERLAAK